jgi:hypothetical protein
MRYRGSRHPCLGCHSQRARFRYRGRVRADCDHTLCFRCYRSMCDQMRAERMVASSHGGRKPSTHRESSGRHERTLPPPVINSIPYTPQLYGFRPEVALTAVRCAANNPAHPFGLIEGTRKGHFREGGPRGSEAGPPVLGLVVTHVSPAPGLGDDYRNTLAGIVHDCVPVHLSAFTRQ